MKRWGWLFMMLTLSGCTDEMAVGAGPATDVTCPAPCIGTGEIEAGAVTETKLAFDPATQVELDVHKVSGDHDARYLMSVATGSGLLGDGTAASPLAVDPSVVASPDQPIYFFRGFDAVADIPVTPLGLAQTTLYTVPAGKKALVTGVLALNQSGANQSFACHVVNSGGVPSLSNELFNLTISDGDFRQGLMVLLDPGDFVSCVTSTAAGMQAIFAVVEFPDTASLIKIHTSLSPGITALYATPLGKRAFLLPDKFFGSVSSLWFRPTGGTPSVVSFHKVESGGTASNATRIVRFNSDGVNVNLPYLPLGLGPGDSLQIELSAGSANIFGMVIEK